jgi:hypothetical protein
MIFRSLYDEAWCEIERIQDELIGMLRFDIEFAENPAAENQRGCRLR